MSTKTEIYGWGCDQLLPSFVSRAICVGGDCRVSLNGVSLKSRQRDDQGVFRICQCVAICSRVADLRQWNCSCSRCARSNRRCADIRDSVPAKKRRCVGCYKPVRALPYGRLAWRWGKPCIERKQVRECGPTHRRVNFVTFSVHPIDGSSVSVAHRAQFRALPPQ